MTAKKHPVILSMIVRDEALTLRQCLASAAPYVDAIVIVDTGSSPEETPEPETGLRTQAIAEEFGATFRKSPRGCNDQGTLWSFADARNASLELAEDAAMRMQSQVDPEFDNVRPDPWILWLDAADVLIEGRRIAEEVETAEDASQNCIRFSTEMLDARGRVTLRFPRERLIRAFTHAWVYPVHELLAPDRGHVSSAHVAASGLRVQRPFRDRPAREENRNLRILTKTVHEHARPRDLYYLGMEHAQRGDFAEARRWLDVYLRVSRDPDERVLARLMLSELHASRRDQDEALACALRAHMEAPHWPAPKIQIAKLLYLAASRGDEPSANLAGARHFLLDAIERYREPVTHVPMDPRKKTEAHMILGRCSMMVGDYEVAIAAFGAVLDEDTNDPAAKSLRAQCEAMKKRDADAEEGFRRADEDRDDYEEGT